MPVGSYTAVRGSPMCASSAGESSPLALPTAKVDTRVTSSS